MNYSEVVLPWTRQGRQIQQVFRTHLSMPQKVIFSLLCLLSPYILFSVHSYMLTDIHKDL